MIRVALCCISCFLPTERFRSCNFIFSPQRISSVVWSFFWSQDRSMSGCCNRPDYCRSVYKPHKWIRLTFVSVWTRFPLRLASVWEVTGSIPTATTVLRCRVLERRAERLTALYHCNSVSFVTEMLKRERCDWSGAVFLQARFHLTWLMVFITKCCRLLGFTVPYFKSITAYITWNVTFSGIFIH